MLKRFTILIALVLMLVPAYSVGAASMDDVFCGGLPEADCQLLLTNAEVMDGVYSLRFDMSMQMTLGGESSDEGNNLSVAGGGSLAVDPAYAEAIKTASDGAPEADLASQLEALLTAVSGDLAFNISGMSAEETLEMELRLLLKDGVIVMDAGTMEALTDESMDGISWFGVDVSGALADLLSGAGMGALMDEDGTSSPAMEAAAAKATAITRLPDETVSGIPVAVFESTVDISSIIKALTIEDPQTAGSGQVEGADTTLTLLENMDLRAMSSRQYIGLDDHYTHRMDLAMDSTMGGGSVDGGGGGINQTMEIDIYLSAFQESFNVTIPQDAFIFPLAMMMQMGSQ